METKNSGATLQLVMGTGAFFVCFAAFGSVSAMMPILRQRLALSPVQVSIGIAIPVLLGSLGRIPLGLLADRIGGRRVFLGVLAASAVAVASVAFVASYAALVICGFFLGIALASFSVGVGLVSGWYPPKKQGMALGVYGAGNAGQSLAAFGAPVVARALGFAWGFWMFGILVVAWLAFFAIFAKDAPRSGPPKPLREMLAPLRDRKSWMLSLFYSLTFGGFVAMAMYLPIFLTDTFHLAPEDAGLRTAGFVALATALRPIGGVLSDRIGGRTVLRFVFPFTAAAAALLAIPSMPMFTVGALGMAAAIGLGNGAVFKLVPEYFPKTVGGVTGLVGAAGGLGGFFPPLLLGVDKQITGSFTIGFGMLGAFAIVCAAVLWASGRTTRRGGGTDEHVAPALGVAGTK